MHRPTAPAPRGAAVRVVLLLCLLAAPAAFAAADARALLADGDYQLKIVVGKMIFKNADAPATRRLLATGDAGYTARELRADDKGGVLESLLATCGGYVLQQQGRRRHLLATVPFDSCTGTLDASAVSVILQDEGIKTGTAGETCVYGGPCNYVKARVRATRAGAHSMRAGAHSMRARCTPRCALPCRR
jgi:hypothetical protein